MRLQLKPVGLASQKSTTSCLGIGACLRSNCVLGQVRLVRKGGSIDAVEVIKLTVLRIVDIELVAQQWAPTCFYWRFPAQCGLRLSRGDVEWLGKASRWRAHYRHELVTVISEPVEVFGYHRKRIPLASLQPCHVVEQPLVVVRSIIDARRLTCAQLGHV